MTADIFVFFSSEKSTRKEGTFFQVLLLINFENKFKEKRFYYELCIKNFKLQYRADRWKG